MPYIRLTFVLKIGQHRFHLLYNSLSHQINTVVILSRCYGFALNFRVKDVRGYSLSRRVTNRWNSLDQETVDVGTINSFKGMLDEIRKTRMHFLWILHGPQSPRPHGDGTSWGHTRWVSVRTCYTVQQIHNKSNQSGIRASHTHIHLALYLASGSISRVSQSITYSGKPKRKRTSFNDSRPARRPNHYGLYSACLYVRPGVLL